MTHTNPKRERGRALPAGRGATVTERVLCATAVSAVRALVPAGRTGTADTAVAHGRAKLIST